ncbi:hypothetical protein MJO28_004728 [Puccinia striiformis f. sp. tritici]|uniref:TatD DNase family Scn1 n=2 Tax=Puccinia striiformis TaxID=27350 RepID=A0A2S4V205_9BASI|nr:hypothetical protein MJO28_004728 [Puccinia striiformis f. sp. tritici]POW03531.1 hypothetical protein PSTT_11024 [Puccinia striiformis]
MQGIIYHIVLVGWRTAVPLHIPQAMVNEDLAEGAVTTRKFGDDVNRVDQEVFGRLTDAHCHPNDAFHGIDMARAAEEIKGLAIGKVCVMSSSLESQAKTEELVNLQPDKVIPAFGLHPWFTSRITLSEQEVDKRDHYRSILTKQNYPPVPPSSVRPSQKQKEKQKEDEERHIGDQEEIQDWVELHLHLLPQPICLDEFLTEMRARLERFPTSIVGEIGLDKSFTFQIEQPPKTSTVTGPSTEQPTDKVFDSRLLEQEARVPMIKSKYKISISHQLEVLRAQIELAIEIGRPISLHCVQAPTELLDLIDQLIARWGVQFTGFVSRHRSGKGGKSREADRAEVVRGNTTHQEDLDGERRTKGINLCWHSPNISLEILQQALQKLPQTVYFSYSNELATLYSSRFPPSSSHSKTYSTYPTQSSQEEKTATLEELYSARTVRAIRATPIDRLLIESDHGSDPVLIDDKLRQIFHLIKLVKSSPPGNSGASCTVDSNRDLDLVAQIEDNWNRFYLGL